MFGNSRSPFTGLPPVTLNLLILNAICLLASEIFAQKGINLNYILGLHYVGASKFNLFQPITYMFMHANFSHLFFNMFSLFMFGRVLEQYWGSKRFLIYYLVTGIGAGFVQEVVWFFQVQEVLSNPEVTRSVDMMTRVVPQYLNNMFLTVGASGAVFGILLAFGMLFPNAPLFLMFIPVPIKAKYFVIGYGVLELFLGVSGSNDNIAHFAHLGGMIFGFILIKIWQRQRI